MCCLTSEQCESQLRITFHPPPHQHCTNSTSNGHQTPHTFFQKQRKQGQKGVFKVVFGAHKK